MSELTSRILSSNEPAFAPLRRVDLASFVVSLPDGVILAATPPCAALGIRETAPAPVGPKAVARRVAAGARNVMRLERVRLPSTFIPRVFACRAIESHLGRMVLFADPKAIEPQTGASLAVASLDTAPSGMLKAAVQKPLRFSFETDEMGRLTFLTHSFWDAVTVSLAPAGTPWLGRSFEDLAQAGIFSDAAPLSAALETSASFSDVQIWTRDVPPRRVGFGGVPLSTSERRHLGTRGFGLLWPAAERPDTSVADAHPAPRDAPAQGGENVVPLRGGALTARERTAFHEIARTLSHAIETWPRSGAASTAADSELETDVGGPATITPLGREAAPARGIESPETGFTGLNMVRDGDDEAGLMDRLPLGVVVEQQGEIVRVNRTLLGWVGAPDRQAFLRSGGLNAHIVRDPTDGRLMLVPLEGAHIPVELRLVSAPWQGRTALVHVIRCLDPAERALPEVISPPVVKPASENPPSPAPASDLSLALSPSVNLGVEREIARAQALDLIPLPVFLLDESGAIRDANAAAVDLSGFSRSELQSEPFTLLFTTQSQKAAVALLDAADAADDGEAREQAGSVPLKVRHRTGGECQMEAVIAPASEHPPRFCLLLRPPSAAEMAFRMLPVPHERTAESEAVAGDVSLELAGFTRRVSGAVRDPLTGILGFIDAVRSAAFGPLGNSRYAKQAEAAFRHGQLLLSSLEDIEQIVPAHTSFLTDTVALAGVAEEAVAHLAGSARRRRILVRCDLVPDLEICVSAPAIARIVRLLLEEALRATPPGGQVFVSSRLDPSSPGRATAVLLVRDGGAGLSEEEIAQALDPMRPALTTDRFSAAGLPFRMARIAALARAQNGTLTLRRGVDVGMLCELHIPI